MKVSIVIPAYNEEAYIGECLRMASEESRRGTYDTEVIVVNNASTDVTADIARSFDGVVVVDEPRKGLSRARSTGFNASKGDLIANVDADTRMPPGWIGRVMDEFQQDQGLVALSGPVRFYDLPAIPRGLVYLYFCFAVLLHVINHRLLRTGAVLQGGNFVVRRSALEAIGGYDLQYDFYGEDCDVARRIQRVGRVKFTLKLPMNASGRRLKKEGLAMAGFRYVMNYFWTTFLRRPYNKSAWDIRE
jgi:glycosyltransferase involved in cell wall biosynthesis